MAVETYEIAVQRADINDARLCEELVELAPACTGHRRTKGVVYVTFAAQPTQAQELRARELVAAHNPALLTAAQQAEIQRQQAEAAARPAVDSAVAGYDAAMADLTTNWSSLDPSRNIAALRQGVILALRMARWLVARSLK